ncbi:MAG: glycosidase [Acidimicrobiia bacterium]|nr:glycosidase [Acidimicrobiia bacterium]
MNAGRLPDGVMLNAYPDSVGGTLDALVDLLRPGQPLADTASLFYILPSLYNSDLDRGFSVVDYDINNVIATEQDLRDLAALGLELKLDFVLNHISVQSSQFRDLLARGDDSPYVDFFVDWNEFWAGEGEMGPDGYVIPNDEHMAKLFMRKPGLPILEVPFPDGSSRFYWNTFYQSVTVDPPTAAELKTDLGLAADVAGRVADEIAQRVAAGEPLDLADDQGEVERYIATKRTHYLGQMDLNAQSDAVWDYYDESLRKMRDYGARIIRLDAFAYLHKEVGRSNFFNEPGTWDYLNRLQQIADGYGLLLLPEIHSRYDEGIHRKLAANGFAFYDFFFPGLVIDAIETGSGIHLLRWVREVGDQGYLTVNMLGCHDGIPLLDIKGLLDEAAIDRMIETILARGGMVKDLYGPDGKKISYYQVNATFFSALDADPSRFLLARAIQMFMPGVPEVWYLDLFAGTNDHEAAAAGGHKEINRTNLTLADVAEKLSEPVVQTQLELLRFRNQFPAFGFDAELSIDDSDQSVLSLTWRTEGHSASLRADLTTTEFEITYEEAGESRRLEI